MKTPFRPASSLPLALAFVLAAGAADAQDKAKVAPAVSSPPSASAKGKGEAAPSPQVSVPLTNEKAGPRTDLEASLAEVDAALAPLLDEKAAKGDRLAAAKKVEDLGPDAVPAIGKRLAELRKGPTGAVHAVFKQLREDSGKKAGDLLAAVLDLPKTDGPGAKTTLATVALARALVKGQSVQGAREWAQLAGDHDGLFRPELTRQTKAFGEPAIPALMEARKTAVSAEAKRWAALQLDALGKRTPGEAVQVASPDVLAEVLAAFGKTKDNDAIAVIVSFVNTDRTQVRTAARAALATFGGDAIWKLREAYTNLVGKQPPETWGAEQVAKELYASFDKVRLEEVLKQLDEGLAKEKAGDHEGAVALFDGVLARQPLLDRRTETVAAYVARAQQIEDEKPAEALALYRKARALDPDGPRAGVVGGAIAFLEGKQGLARGIADSAAFKHALELDPGHPKARAELDRLEADLEEKQARIRRFAAGGAILAVAIALLIFFGGSKSTPRPKGPKTDVPLRDGA